MVKLKKVCEASTSKVFMLTLSNGNPAVLNNHLWFFDSYLGERLFRIANKQIKSKGLQIKDVPVDSSEIKGDVLSIIKKNKNNIVVGNREDFNKLIDSIIKDGNPKSVDKTQLANVYHQEPWLIEYEPVTKKSNEASLCKEENNKAELKKIRNKIIRDKNIQEIQRHIYRDDGAWGPFRNLISLIKGVEGVNNVFYKDSDRYPQGYRWDKSVSKMPVAKERDIEIETDFGTLTGSIICSGAGSVEDPLDSYDMILNVYLI